MENPYWRVFGNFLYQAVDPLPTFIGWVLWFSFLQGVANYIGDARQYEFLIGGLVVRVCTGEVAWGWAGYEAAWVYLAASLPVPAITGRLMSLSSVSRIGGATLKVGVVRYFTFQGTDEANLGIIVGNLAPLSAFVAVAITPSALRFFWAQKIWILALVMVLAPVAFMPDVRQLRLVSWVGKVALAIVKFFIRAYFYVLDTSTAIPPKLMRSVEAWESRCARGSVEALPSYTYRPLDPAKREIRLLRLRKRTLRPQVECEFIHTSVDEAPAFEAVSYTWGGESLTEGLTVDGRRVAVTPTVGAWLRYRRSFFSEAYLWIDAICINQGSKDEKSNQIPLMRDIYSQADRTIVWLAHPNEVRDSHEARSLLMTLCTLAATGATAAHLQYVVSTDTNMTSVLRLLARNYFHRIWIVQEIALAKRVHIVYGDVTMEWDSLALAAKALFDSRLIGSMSRASDFMSGMDIADSSIPSRHMANIMGITELRNTCQAGQQLDLLYALISMEDFTATVPHDSIFGFLGLVGDLPEFLRLLDYDEPVEKLYARLTKYLLERPGVASVLQLAGSGYEVATLGGGRLPSWVPDLSNGFIGRRRNVVEHRTPPWRGPGENGADKVEWNILRMDHHEIGTIKTIQTHTFLPMTSRQTAWRHNSQDMWKSDRSTPTLSETDIVTFMRDHFTNFLDWHDEAAGILEASPLSRALYGGDTLRAFFQTLSCNDAQLNDRADGDEDRGFNRYAMAVALIRAMHGMYQERLDGDERDMGRRILDMFNLTPEAWTGIITPELNHFFYWLGALASRRRFCLTESGMMCMVPPGARAGDAVSYIRGQSMPFVLRRVEGRDGFMDLVGGCYVHGVPDAPAGGDEAVDGWEEVRLI